MWLALKGKEIKACALTEVGDGYVILDFCSGVDRHEWRDAMVDEIRRWGEFIGCKRMKVICRPGWAREIKGFKETHRVLERDI